jgi:hypothetical protein
LSSDHIGQFKESAAATNITSSPSILPITSSALSLKLTRISNGTSLIYFNNLNNKTLNCLSLILAFLRISYL